MRDLWLSLQVDDSPCGITGIADIEPLRHGALIYEPCARRIGRAETDPSVAPHKRRDHLESLFLDILNNIGSSSSRGRFFRVGSLA